MAAWFDNWKGVLGSAAAGLVVILQLVQVLLSIGIENVIDNKTEQLRVKTDALSVLLNVNGEISRGNRALLEDNRARILAIEKEIQILESAEKQQEADYKTMLEQLLRKQRELEQQQEPH